MSRRPGNPPRRLANGGGFPFVGSMHSKSRSSPLLSIGLVVVGAILLIVYCYSGSGGHINDREALSNVEGSCTLEVHRALPILKKAYGDSMHKVLHVGPETCSVVSNLLKEEDTEAWGVEPYDLDDVEATWNPGQQRAKVAELSKFGRPAKFRSSSWWIRYFLQTGLEENEAAAKKFEHASWKRSYKPACQVFHLTSYA